MVAIIYNIKQMNPSNNEIHEKISNYKGAFFKDF